MSFSDSDGYDDWGSNVSDGEPYLALKEEVRSGRYQAILEALKDGSDPNDCDHDHGGYTLLHWAAGMTDEDNLDELGSSIPWNMARRRQIVRLLLERGANAWGVWWRQEFFGNSYGHRTWDLTEDEETRIASQTACVNQVLAKIEEDAETPRETQNSGLVAAAALNSTEAIKKILEAGADINNDCCDVTALSVASAEGDLDSVKILIEDYGAVIDHDIDQYGQTALRCAADEGKSGVVEYLSEQGTDPFLEQECMGPMPMFVANTSVLDMLLKAMHSKVDAAISLDDGQRGTSRYSTFEAAFHISIAFGYNEDLFSLFQGGIPPPSASLQTAVAFGQIDTLELLLAEGALKTYGKNEKPNYYGCGGRRSSNDAVMEAQRRLDETVAAAKEWQEMTLRTADEGHN